MAVTLAFGLITVYECSASTLETHSCPFYMELITDSPEKKLGSFLYCFLF